AAPAQTQRAPEEKEPRRGRTPEEGELEVLPLAARPPSYRLTGPAGVARARHFEGPAWGYGGVSRARSPAGSPRPTPNRLRSRSPRKGGTADPRRSVWCSLRADTSLLKPSAAAVRRAVHPVPVVTR